MPILLPPLVFAHCTDNQPSTPSAASHGVACTPGTSNADGSSVTLLSAVTHDVHRVVIHISNTFTGNQARYQLADLLVDPAGGTSWVSLIDDLVCGMLVADATAAQSGCWYDFPLWVPAGTSFGMRMRTSHSASTAARVSLWVYGEPNYPDRWWCGQRVETLGVTASTSKGTDLTPGGSHSWGSWTSIGSNTSFPYGYLQVGYNGTDAAAASQRNQYEVGIGSNTLGGLPPFYTSMQTSESGIWAGTEFAYNCQIPAGSQLQLRGMSDAGSPEVVNMAIYGVG